MQQVWSAWMLTGSGGHGSLNMGPARGHPRNDEKPPAPYVVRGALVCVWRGGVAGVNVG